MMTPEERNLLRRYQEMIAAQNNVLNNCADLIERLEDIAPRRFSTGLFRARARNMVKLLRGMSGV